MSSALHNEDTCEMGDVWWHFSLSFCHWKQLDSIHFINGPGSVFLEIYFCGWGILKAIIEKITFPNSAGSGVYASLFKNCPKLFLSTKLTPSDKQKKWPLCFVFNLKRFYVSLHLFKRSELQSCMYLWMHPSESASMCTSLALF